MLTVLYEYNHLLAINKPSGTLVRGDATRDKPLVDICKDYIKEKYKQPGDVFLGVVHRLDRPVTGVVVFARTSKALEQMNELFTNRDTPVFVTFLKNAYSIKIWLSVLNLVGVRAGSSNISPPKKTHRGTHLYFIHRLHDL